MALSRIGVSKQPGAQLFEWERGAMNVQNGVDLLGQKGFRSRTYHICIQRSLVRGSTLEFSTPSPPLIRVQDRFECLFFSFFHSFFARLQQTRSIFPPSSGWNAPRRGACDEFARVTESREFSYFRRDDRQKGM